MNDPRDDDAPIPRPEPAARRAEDNCFWERDPDQPFCFCIEVSAGEVLSEIRKLKSNRVQDIADATGAGTACGSCRLDIARMIETELGLEPDMSYESVKRSVE